MASRKEDGIRCIPILFVQKIVHKSPSLSFSLIMTSKEYTCYRLKQNFETTFEDQSLRLVKDSKPSLHNYSVNVQQRLLLFFFYLLNYFLVAMTSSVRTS